MDQDEIDKKAKNFLKNQKIATLATIDGKQPWITNIRFVTDENSNVYFLSSLSARHIENIMSNEKTALSLYYMQENQMIKELKIEGTVEPYNKENLKDIFDDYDIKYPNALNDDEIYKDFKSKNATSKFFRFIPEIALFRDPEFFEGKREVNFSN